MNVLFNALQAGNRSGTGAYTTALAARLAGEHDGVTVHVVWPYSLPAPDGVAAPYVHRFSAGARRLYVDQVQIPRLARRLEADAIHYPANIGAVSPVRTPQLLTVHDLSFVRHPEWFRWERSVYYRRGVEASVRKAAHVFSVSESTGRELVELLHVPADRITVTHNGVDPGMGPAADSAVAAARQRYGLPERCFIYLGTLEPRKNLATLVEAFDQLAASLPLDLVLAGRKGWKTGPILEAVRQARHADRIHLPGFVPNEDLAAVLSAAEVFVYPSLYEGFGIPLADALACGVPAVTGNTTSLPEVAGDAALTVDASDPAALAEAMRRAVVDTDLRARLAARGPEQVARFTWDTTAAATLATYRRLGAGDLAGA